MECTKTGTENHASCVSRVQQGNRSRERVEELALKRSAATRNVTQSPTCGGKLFRAVRSEFLSCRFAPFAESRKHLESIVKEKGGGGEGEEEWKPQRQAFCFSGL